jgi:hypothetical protein
MDPSNSNEQTKKSLTGSQKLLIGAAIAAGLAALSIYFLWWVPKPRTDPPPIIVKSGSFDLESDVEADVQVVGGNRVVKIPNSVIGRMIIQRYNKDSSTVLQLYDGAFQPLRIWMEEATGMPTDPTFIIEQEGTALRLTSSEKLKKGRGKHSGRSHHIVDEDRKFFRFGQIQVGGNSPIPAQDGDEFFILFYRQ